MSGSLLSWDDLEEDENPRVAAAAKAVKEIDTAPVMAAVAEQEKVYQEQKQAPKELKGLHPEILERAILAIHNMDGQLPHGGRLNADDKKLLNSATDLNQLVPFKYDWAWTGYLESCAAHWMPTEINLDKDITLLNERRVTEGVPPTGKEPFVLPLNERKIICDLLVNHQFIRAAVPNQTWLNLYRMIENPEVRQYLLRQAFEETLADHVMMYIQESTNVLLEKVSNISIVRHLHLLDESYKERYKLLRNYLPMMIGDSGTTVGKENLREFIIELAVLYGVANWLSPMRSIYHVIKLHRTAGKFDAIAKIADLVLRDLVHHQQIFKLVLDTAIAENPEVIDDELRTEIVKRVKRLGLIEEDMYSLFSVDEYDYADLTWFLKYNQVNLFTMFGIHASGNNPMPSAFMGWFMDNLKNHEVKLHGGGVTVTSGGTSGGALSW